jgi:hypothetical protein
LLAAQLTVSHFEQFAGPGIAGITSPTGIARRPDDAGEFNDSPSLSRVLIEKNSPPINSCSLYPP